ncbi:MAG TPA: 50S ribosomal protein L29 [Candidatus Nanoarchaeia archaeon]|nr:50S ribosomal protein L29 [Candidatus Nanoarchaeia archaeon]
MSVKKIKEFRGLSDSELKKRLEELRKELIKLNAQVATGTVPKSPGLIKDTKKGIAMILTVLRKKELEKLEEKRTKKQAKEETKTNE